MKKLYENIEDFSNQIKIKTSSIDNRYNSNIITKYQAIAELGELRKELDLFVSLHANLSFDEKFKKASMELAIKFLIEYYQSLP